MNRFILSVGRHKSYPYLCFITVIGAFLYTDPWTHFNLRYSLSFFGAITGLICVLLLTRRHPLGNYFGLLAAIGESIGNFLGNNIGAGLPHIYNATTHVYGIVDWKKHHDETDKVITRSLKPYHYLYLLLIFLGLFGLNIVVTQWVSVNNSQSQLLLNSFILGLAVPAQTLLMMRYYFSWYLWIIMNVLVIILNFFGPDANPVIGAQYCIYLFNASYGLIEWKTFAESHAT